jgi:hypothetical protein
MTLHNSAAIAFPRRLPSLAAVLTDAAYTIVLRHGISGSWIDLELELWQVLALSVAQKERTSSRSHSAVEFLACREKFLSELTDAAYRTALHYGLRGSFLDVELDLDLALREVLERSRSNSVLHFGIGAGAPDIADAVLARLAREYSPRAGVDCCRM